jgi:acyl carrier protein
MKLEGKRMTPMALTEERLIAYVKDSLQFDGELCADTPLFSSGALDSGAMMNVIAFVEESAGVTVRAEDVTLENFDTPARIAGFAASQA